MENVDWGRIARSIEFYQNNGYTYMETPWVVDLETTMITCPDRNSVVKLHENPQSNLVGSAEQGFLFLAKSGYLKGNELLISAGPCFRNEPEPDRYHQPYFFKVELFSLCEDEITASERSERMKNDALNFMTQESNGSEMGYAKQDGNLIDITVNRIETGSYGFRYHDDIGWWAYGTGLAEPRFKQAMENK